MDPKSREFKAIVDQFSVSYSTNVKLRRRPHNIIPLLDKGLQIINNFTDDEFYNFINYINNQDNFMNSKIYKDHHKFLRKLVFFHTLDIQKDRLLFIQDRFPIMRGIYFGKKFNSLYYNQLDHCLSFKSTDIPQFKSLVDFALCFNKNVDYFISCTFSLYKEPSPHYNRYPIPKNNSGNRMITAPKDNLKEVQKLIYQKILQKAEIPSYVTGFVPGKNILDNAKIHLFNKVILNMDIRRCFPSLHAPQVFQVFKGFGYSNPIAGVLTSVCTDWDGKRRYLPQGAPSSPMIMNLYLSRFDKRIKNLANSWGFRYSRYADDLTFSSRNNNCNFHKFIQIVTEIAKEEKIQINRSKTRILRKHYRQEITGIVINENVNVDRKWRRLLRAEIHHYNTRQFSSKEKKQRLLRKIQGKLSFLKSINPRHAKKFYNMIEN